MENLSAPAGAPPLIGEANIGSPLRGAVGEAD